MKSATAAIVPAYNEEPRIGSVLDTILESGLFRTIVAVDDGSHDETWNEILARPVMGIRHPSNRGKAAALQTGIKHLPDFDAVAFIDADLTGLRTEHLADLLLPVLHDPRCLMTVAKLTRARAAVDVVQQYVSILNGQRVLARGFVDRLPDLSPVRFGVEVFLTRYARALGPGHTTVAWPGVSHVMKEEKYGLIPGFYHRLRMYYEVLHTYWIYYPNWAKHNLPSNSRSRRPIAKRRQCTRGN